MTEPLTDEYIRKATQDARMFQANWDCGTSGVLAAHTFRLIRERETHLNTIAELERRNAELRSAVESRLTGSTQPQLPPEVAEKLVGLTLSPASPVKVEQIRPQMIGSSMPAGAMEAAWAGLKARREQTLARVRGEIVSEPISVEEIRLHPKRRHPTLIGLTGRAGAGKSLAASMVPEGVVMQLADPLYDMLEAMLGIPGSRLRDRRLKETKLDWIGRSPRELLQTLGTEWGRGMIRQDVWLLIAGRRIDELVEAGTMPIVVADVRFDNEAAMIRDRGGEVWEIVRDHEPIAAGHPSEGGISRELIDTSIANVGTIDQLRAAVLGTFSGV